MTDRLGVNMYPVMVGPPRPAVKAQILQRMQVLEREAEHLARAARLMQAGVNGNQSRLLTEGMLNSRNWMLSVLMSHIVLQAALEGSADASDQAGLWPKAGTARAFVVADILVPRAARFAMDDGSRLRG